MTKQEAKAAELAAYGTWLKAGGKFDTPEHHAAWEATRAYLRIIEETTTVVGNYVPASTGSTGEDWFDESR
jgi:hypothetical protein